MPSSWRRDLGRVLRLLWPRWRSFAWMFVIGGIIQGLSVVVPYLSRLLIDRVYPTRDIGLMHVLVGCSVAVLSSSILLQNAQALFARLVQTDLHLDLTQRLYAHLVGLPVAFFQSRGAGEISSRFQIIRSSLITVIALVGTLARNYGFLLLVPPLLFTLDPVLGFAAIWIIPPSAYLTFREARLVQRDMRVYLALIGEADTFQAETCAKMRSLKALHLETYCRQRFAALAAEAAAVQRQKYQSHAYYNTAANALRAASLSLCTWLGWEYILSGRLTLGELIAFMAYFAFLSTPVREVVDSLAASMEAAVFLAAVGECLEQPSEASTWSVVPRQPRRSPVGHELACHDVTFAYGDGPPVLTGLDAAFREGTMTAIIGLSGAGKTTLLQLLVGFMVPCRGRITLGGVDTRELSLDDLRSRISVVWQDDSLLSTSLWDNLIVGSAISKARVDRVVELCQLTELVTALPDGYQTLVGDKGVRLSAGQRQRLAIARAILRARPVMLFDEATANIDVLRESALLAGIADACRDRVIVLVTHRATTAMLADRVLLCADGTLRDVTTDIRGMARDKLPASVEASMRTLLAGTAVPA